jgi:eukaryotic-like serine/threonine-protein kinase
MTAARLARVEGLFAEVVDLPEGERSARLHELSQGDQSLVTDVLKLLEADVSDCLNRDLGTIANRLLASDEPPKRFGRYRLLRFLGQGGMGRVYLAEREDLGDRVAVKFLESGWNSPEARARFASEQQTLASLTHPHIARLYDAGVEGDVPWFAMEYVEGAPINEYCRLNELDLQGRLRLLRDVCEAVSYAHRNLVVHLDLKPSNILVNSNGEVKLVDFGVARNLPRDGRAADKTRTGFRMVSLNYAAPEQFRGEALDVQTDVHGLGILAYELLTGSTPADLANATAPELLQYTEQPVTRPSEVARGDVEPFLAISKAQWRDLDVLCLTALHRDRARRYSTVEAFERDVNHFVRDEPLEAQTDSLRYRAAKFLKRNRRPVGATVAAVAAIVILSAIFTWRLVRAKTEALSAQARMERIHHFMLDLFQGDEASGPSKELRVIDMLDRGVAQADSLGREPVLQAELRYTFGTLYQQLGHNNKAEPLLTEALQEQMQQLGADDPATWKTQLALARLRQDQSRFVEAERVIQDVMQRAKRRFAPDSREVATAEGALGSLLVARGDYRNAISKLRHADSVLSGDPDAATTDSNVLGELANCYYYMGDTPRNEEVLQRSLALDQKRFGPHHPGVAVDLYNSGLLRLDQGQYAAAAELFQKALAINLQWFGELHEHTAETLFGLAGAFVGQHRYDEAKAASARALNAVKASVGDHDKWYGVVLAQMGDVSFQQNRFEEAEGFYGRAAAILKETLGAKNEMYGANLGSVGRAEIALGHYREGEKLQREALAIVQAAVPDGRYAGVTKIRLSRALAGEKRYAEAEKEGLEGYEILKRKTGVHSLDQQSARKQLREVYLAMNQPAKAALYDEPR